MEPNPKDVGQRIKEIRAQKGLSQKDFAKRTNSTIPAISNWENGRNLPNKERLKSIADLADISVDELLYGSNRKVIKKAIEDAFNERITKGSSYYTDYESDKGRYQDLANSLYLKLATNELYTKYNGDLYSIIKKLSKDEIFKEYEKGERTRENLEFYLWTILQGVLFEIEDYRNDDITKKAIEEGTLTKSDLEILNKVKDRIIEIAENF